MQITVSNFDRFDRLSHHDGRHPIHPFLAAGSVFALTDCLAVSLGPRDGDGNLSVATLHLSLLPLTWQTNDLRVVFELALLGFGVVSLWQAIRNRHRRTQEKLAQRQRAGKLYKHEHTRRLKAEGESHTLSQRLITAHEDERKHLARALHDDVSQRLARLALDASQIERGLPTAADSGAWRRMREELVRLSDDVHSLAYRLHPSILEELGLIAALRAECDRFSRQESIPVNIRLQALPDEIPREAALCLFRVCQESLRNAARHAHAHGADVFLIPTDGGLQLAVHDDGIGFNPAKVRAHASLGLTSMTERVHLANGELDIQSEPGHGTTIVAWVPLKEAL